MTIAQKKQDSYAYRSHLICLLPLLGLLCALRLFIGTEQEVKLFFDHYRHAHPQLSAWLRLVTDFGNPLFYPVYAWLLYRSLRRGDLKTRTFVLCWLAAQIMLTFLLGQFLKAAIGRPRPLVGGPFVPFASDYSHNSFPSGHTAEIIGNCVPLAQRFAAPLLTAGLALWVTLLGFTRIYFSAHYPSDILGGMALGSLAAYAAWRMRDYVQSRAAKTEPTPSTDQMGQTD